MKLAGGSPALAGELSVDAFLAQARDPSCAVAPACVEVRCCDAAPSPAAGTKHPTSPDPVLPTHVCTPERRRGRMMRRRPRPWAGTCGEAAVAWVGLAGLHVRPALHSAAHAPCLDAAGGRTHPHPPRLRPAHPLLPLPASCSNAQTRALSHPLPVLRAREIDRWAQSQQYKALLSANLPRNSTGANGAGPSSGGTGQQTVAAR